MSLCLFLFFWNNYLYVRCNTRDSQKKKKKEEEKGVTRESHYAIFVTKNAKINQPCILNRDVYIYQSIMITFSTAFIKYKSYTSLQMILCLQQQKKKDFVPVWYLVTSIHKSCLNQLEYIADDYVTFIMNSISLNYCTI